MGTYANSHKEQIETKYALKCKLEELRHKNIMAEIKLMAKLGVQSLERYGKK